MKFNFFVAFVCNYVCNVCNKILLFAFISTKTNQCPHCSFANSIGFNPCKYTNMNGFDEFARTKKHNFLITILDSMKKEEVCCQICVYMKILLFKCLIIASIQFKS